jgi:hypothetical protein
LRRDWRVETIEVVQSVFNRARAGTNPHGRPFSVPTTHSA